MKTALIIDDLEQNIYLLRSILEGHNFEVMCATNGAEALELARNTPPDIAISDILMPTMDGFTLLREWKKDGALQNIPLIIYTATYTDHKDEELALRLGAARFIVKPVEPEVFIDAVRQVMEENKADHVVLPADPDDETVYYRMYNETLIRKLEHKMLQMEKAAAAIEMASLKWSTTFDAMLDPVALLKFDGTIEQCNRAFADFIGMDFSALVGQQCYTLIHQSDDHIEGCPLVKARESCTRETMELPLGDKIFLVVADPVKTADNEITGFVHIMNDITELKRTQEALQSKNNELIHFNYTVSNDLKNPLVTIKTFLGYLEQDMTNADAEHVTKDMDYIHAAADKMNALLDKLLDLSRIGRESNPPVEAPLQEIVQQALKLISGRIAERDVHITVDPKTLMLYGDRVRLVEVFQNLIDNAAKFMGDQSEPLIEIGAEMTDESIICYVRDNGMGIDPRHAHKLFGLFEQLHPEIKGAGIGLAIIKRIIEVHGGRIWVESEGIGKGSCFWFTLPKKSSES